MFFLKIKPFFRGYEVTGLRRLQGYEIAKSSIYLATTEETCHFHLRKDKIFIQGEKRPKSYINLDSRVNSTACLPIRNSKVNIIRF